jgi:hypothetical protein
MKKLLLVGALMLGSAHAETITFLGSPCDANRNCYPVLTDDPSDLVQLYANPSFTQVTIYLNGTAFANPYGNAAEINTVVFDANGNPATLVVTFASYKTQVRSGRGQYYVTHWSITGGSLTK